MRLYKHADADADSHVLSVELRGSLHTDSGRGGRDCDGELRERGVGAFFGEWQQRGGDVRVFFGVDRVGLCLVVLCCDGANRVVADMCWLRDGRRAECVEHGHAHEQPLGGAACRDQRRGAPCRSHAQQQLPGRAG